MEDLPCRGLLHRLFQRAGALQQDEAVGEDEDGIDGRIGHEGGRGVVNFASELGRPLLRPVGAAVPEADETSAGAFLHGGGVEDGDVAGPDEPDADGLFRHPHVAPPKSIRAPRQLTGFPLHLSRFARVGVSS